MDRGTWQGQRSYSPWGCRVGHDWVTQHIHTDICVYIYIYIYIIMSAPTELMGYVKWQLTSTNRNWSYYAICYVFARALKGLRKKTIGQLIYSYLSLLLKENFSFLSWFMVLNSIKNSFSKRNARYGGLVTKSCPTLATPQIVAHHSPLTMGFSRQEYWSMLHFPSSEELSSPEIEPCIPWITGIFFFFNCWATREAQSNVWLRYIIFTYCSISFA